MLSMRISVIFVIECRNKEGIVAQLIVEEYQAVDVVVDDILEGIDVVATVELVDYNEDIEEDMGSKNCVLFIIY